MASGIDAKRARNEQSCYRASESIVARLNRAAYRKYHDPAHLTYVHLLQSMTVEEVRAAIELA